MADNNLDPDDIRQLTESIRDLTGSMAKSNDPAWKNMSASDLGDRVKKAQADKLDADIKKLAKTINETKDAAQKKKLQDELFLKTQEKQKKAADDNINSLYMLTAAQRRALAEADAMASQQKARAEFGAKIAAMQADKTGTILKGLASAGSMINKTFLDSTRGQGKYGEVLDGAADGLSKLSVLFGPFGKAAIFVTGGLLKLGAAALRHNEEMMKAYESLSEFGQLDASGTQQLFDNLQNAGFVMKEMDKFQGVMKGASQDLAFLGDTAALGQKNITNLYGKTLNTQTEKTLKNLGFTNEQALKTYVNYSSNLAKLGILQGKSQDQVARGSSEYAVTLDELTKLTGMQRDELQEKLKQAQSDVKYRYAMMSASEAQQKQMQAMAIASAGYGEEYAAGIREMMANGGQAVTESAMKINLLTDGAASRIMTRFSKGEVTWEQAQQELAMAQDKTIKRLAPLGKISSEAVGQFGVTAQVMENTNLWMTKNDSVIKRIKEDQAKQASGELDAQRSAETARQVSERKGEQAKDKLNQLIGKGISPAMQGLEIVTTALGKAMANVVKMITFGKVDLTSAYATNDEKVEEKEKELRDVKLKLGRAQRSRNAKEQEKLQAQYDLIQQQLSDLKGGVGGESQGGTASSGGNGGNATVINKTDGTKETRTGGTRAWRNNNPGNLRPGQYSTQYGAIGESGGYAVFASEAAGQRAMERLLFESPLYKDKTLYQAIMSYAPPQDKNDTASYINNVANGVGVSPQTVMSSLDTNQRQQLLKVMRNIEGWKAGDVSTSTAAGTGTKQPATPASGQMRGRGSPGKIPGGDDGGVFNGPASGYPVMMHKREMIVPLPENTSAADIANVTKQALATAGSGATSTSSINSADFLKFVAMMETKFDALLEQARRQHGTQEELLQHTKA